jgi:hypothetical protein
MSDLDDEIREANDLAVEAALDAAYEKQRVLAAQLAEVTRERDSLARRCAVRYEETATLREQLAAAEARTVWLDTAVASRDEVVDAARVWRQRLDRLDTEPVGVWHETLSLVLAVDALDAVQADVWRPARSGDTPGELTPEGDPPQPQDAPASTLVTTGQPTPDFVERLAQAMRDDNPPSAWTHPNIVPMYHFATVALRFLSAAGWGPTHLDEEVQEAFAEDKPQALRAELVQDAPQAAPASTLVANQFVRQPSRDTVYIGPDAEPAAPVTSDPAWLAEAVRAVASALAESYLPIPGYAGTWNEFQAVRAVRVLEPIIRRAVLLEAADELHGRRLDMASMETWLRDRAMGGGG